MKKNIVIILIFFTSYLSAQEMNFDRFSLVNLQNYRYRTSPITIQKLAFNNELQYAYDVVYRSMGLTVSARLRIPTIDPQEIKGIVIMLRGHQRREGYYIGRGTENSAETYLRHGWAVIAPDFLGYGASSPAPAPWEMHQFYSTINAVELYKSLLQPKFRFARTVTSEERITLPSNFKKIVVWGHSNGGQVTLHFLEIIQQPVSTVLWAPVCIDFPENIAHFSRNTEWARLFRENNKIEDFSLLKHLDKIAPGTAILLEQGTRDTAVPKSWSDALAESINRENTRRREVGIGLINFRYEVYNNADHNMNPYRNTSLTGNVRFWESNP